MMYDPKKGGGTLLLCHRLSFRERQSAGTALPAVQHIQTRTHTHTHTLRKRERGGERKRERERERSIADIISYHSIKLNLDWRAA